MILTEEEIMADIFDEINEEIKRDRMQVVWSKYGKYLISAVAAIVAGVALSQGYASWQKSQIENAASAYSAALQSDDVATALESAQSSLTDGYAMLASFQIAAAKADAGDLVAAEQAYIALSQDGSIDGFYQQAALMLSVMNAADGANVDELQARLLPLTGAAGSWQGLALELSAALDLQNGDSSAAKTKLEQVLALPDIPSDLRQRVMRMASIFG